MSWEASAGKLAAIRLYALQTERLALAAALTQRKGFEVDYNYDKVREIYRTALGSLNDLRDPGDNIDCVAGTFPCEGLCMPDPCPKPPATGGGQEQASSRSR